MTSVSIAMATYNGRQHIRRQLDSLAAQTLIPLNSLSLMTDPTMTRSPSSVRLQKTRRLR
jgi:GT2 family glycosyltransferase